MLRLSMLTATSALLLASCGNPSGVSELQNKLYSAEAALAEAEERAQEAQADLTALQLISDEVSDLAEEAIATMTDRADVSGDLIDRDGESIGRVLVMDGPHGMVLRLQGSGLPLGLHGSHLHVVGDCSDPAEGFKAAAGHINLTGDEHGLLNPAGYHVGSNFPNFWVGGETFVIETFANDLTLAEAMDEDGFALIIHENEDDHVTQPIGGAGARLACAAFN